MTTAIAVRKPATMTKPRGVKLNADGKATKGFETIEVPMPAELRTECKILVGLFSRSAERLPGWYAEAVLGRPAEIAQTGCGRERWHVVCDAADALVNRLVDRTDDKYCPDRARLKAVIAALNAFSERYEKESKQEATQMVNARSKILTQKECRALLEDFRRSYQCAMHSFVELGDKANQIREQEAYGETCETFDQWIKSEGYGHTFVYDCMKAARLYRLMAPTLEPRHITLDCESHYREIPADFTPKQVKAVAGELVKAAADHGAKLTRQHVKAAVAAVRPKAGQPRNGSTARPDVPESIEAEIAAVEKPFGPVEPQAPRIVPEAVAVETAEVNGLDEPPPSMVSIGAQDHWSIRFALGPAEPGVDRKLSGFASCLRHALMFDALRECGRKELAGLFRTLADELDPPRRAK